MEVVTASVSRMSKTICLQIGSPITLLWSWSRGKELTQQHIMTRPEGGQDVSPGFTAHTRFRLQDAAAEEPDVAASLCSLVWYKVLRIRPVFAIARRTSIQTPSSHLSAPSQRSMHGTPPSENFDVVRRNFSN